MENNIISENDVLKNQKTAESESLKRTSMFIGLAMLITAAVKIFFGTIYLNIAALFGVDNSTAVSFLKNPYGNELINQFLSILALTLPFLIIISGCSLKISDVISFKKPDKKNLFAMLLLGMSFCGFANVGGNMMFQILSNYGIKFPATSMNSPSGLYGVISALVGGVIIAPLCEEFAMRGVVLGSLRRYGDRFAIFTSALLFGLLHGRIQQIPFAFVVGLVLAFATVKTGSIWTGVIIHAANNLFATVLDYVSKSLSREISMILSYVFFAACLICGFAAIFLLKNDERELLPHGDSPLSSKDSTKIFFLNPSLIIYFIVTVIIIFTKL